MLTLKFADVLQLEVTFVFILPLSTISVDYLQIKRLGCKEGLRFLGYMYSVISELINIMNNVLVSRISFSHLRMLFQ